jgi:hypothetical protein
MRKKKRQFGFTSISLMVISVYLLFAILMLIFVKDWGVSSSIGDSFGIINALFSGVALVGVIYTLFLQRQTLELQREDFSLSIKPLLAVEPTERSRSSYTLKVTNIGNGTALNIDLLPAQLEDNLPVFYRAENMIISLTPGEEKTIEIKAYETENGGELDSSWTAHLHPRYANRVVKVTISYSDIKFNELRQSFELGLGDLRVTMTE